MDPAFLDPRFFEHFDPAHWEHHLCTDLAPVLRLLLDEPGIRIASMGLENVKAPDLAVLLNRPPSPAQLERAERLCADNPRLRANADSIVCFDHYHALEWGAPPPPVPLPPPRPSVFARLFGKRSAG